MFAALSDAGVSPHEIGYVNAHATGTKVRKYNEQQIHVIFVKEFVLLMISMCTQVGDAAEVRALQKVFGARFSSGGLPVSSTKGATGHLLGAAGAVEAAFTIMALSSGRLPPTVGLRAVDRSMMTSSGEIGCHLEPDFIPGAARSAGLVRVAMSNSFGFGGTNASLVFSLPPP